MSINLEWDRPHKLVTPYGTLPLNTPGPALSSGLYPVFLIVPPYTIAPTMRSTRDNISQQDGSSVQPPYLSGLAATLDVQYQTQQFGGDLDVLSPACAQDLREMDELLTLHLNSLRTYSPDPGTGQQLVWTPTGTGDDRLISWVTLAAWMAPDFSNSPLVVTTFQLATPYPYAVDATPVVASISAGNSHAVVNAGSADVKPVITVGACTGFTITNLTTGETVEYDSTRPGAQAITGTETATIDFFLGTIILNDGTDLVAGLVPTATDFFSLPPGTTTIGVTGANIVVTSYNGYL